jgi:galactokinase
MMNDQRQRTCAEFERRFDRPPEWVAIAPGRVNLIGEHVDYCGGSVLPMAIERYTMIAAAPRTAAAGSASGRVFSTAVGAMAEIPIGPTGGTAGDPGGDPSAAMAVSTGLPGWTHYLHGVIAGFLARGAAVPAFDAVVDSTVPLGGGLSSSASLEAAREALGPRVHARARHVVTEIDRTRRAADAIAAGRWAELGLLMAESHASLRDDYEVSCPELDLLVDLAAAERGVIGTRMTGGGFGGCTVTLVEAAHAQAVMDRVAQEYRRHTGRECTMFTTRPAQGATIQTTPRPA